ncbi:hypothetical protein POTOM_033796 [Populus tomentosa]|uniref:Uncharacterized protein n=1 Tax=Populus tomentosa TaxID=118781 RepID=A0A8X7Z642_POPTO|nr:hypothetical protein POTOM_033796 [Populus tomentosa]
MINLKGNKRRKAGLARLAFAAYHPSFDVLGSSHTIHHPSLARYQSYSPGLGDLCSWGQSLSMFLAARILK